MIISNLNAQFRAVELRLTRRALMLGCGASALVAGTNAALAQYASHDVPVDKLMAPDGLSELSQGNENAKVTIIEYASMSCPACASFHRTTYPKLKRKYVDTGKVRLIIREFPLNNLAAAGSMLARWPSRARPSPTSLER